MVFARAGPTPFSSHRPCTLFLSSLLGRGRTRPVILSDFLVCVVLQEVVDPDYFTWHGLELPFYDLLEGFHAEFVVFPDLVSYAFLFAGPSG